MNRGKGRNEPRVRILIFGVNKTRPAIDKDRNSNGRQSGVGTKVNDESPGNNPNG